VKEKDVFATLEEMGRACWEKPQGD